MWAYGYLFWQLSSDRNWHDSGVSHTKTASSKPSFKAPWRVSDGVIGRGNAGWIMSKSGYPSQSQNCSQWSPAEKTGTGSLLNCPSRPANNPISSRTELNCIFIFMRCEKPGPSDKLQYYAASKPASEPCSIYNNHSHHFSFFSGHFLPPSLVLD